MARHHVPDLILSDILMQQGDGTALLRDIRRRRTAKVWEAILQAAKERLTRL